MFELVSSFPPAGDQPAAIDKLVAGIEAQRPHQVLLGVTGSGKTFTIAPGFPGSFIGPRPDAYARRQ